MRFLIPFLILVPGIFSLLKAIKGRKFAALDGIDRVFAAVFFILLAVPGSYIHQKTVNKWENRNYHKAPALFIDGRLNRDFGTGFEKYFSDRIVGRKDFININFAIRRLNSRQTSEKALAGKDNWLFYKYDNSIANFKNESVFTADEKQAILSYIKTLLSRNKNLYVFIAPDKNKIYGEFFPDTVQKVRPDEQSRTYDMIRLIRSETGVPVIYPYAELREAKKAGALLYYKHDTHWNPLGGYYGFRALVREMNKTRPFPVLQTDDKDLVADDYVVSDLARLFPGFKAEPVAYKKLKDFKALPAKDLSVFVLTDSFYTAMIEYFAKSFKSVETHPYKKIKTLDWEKLEKADIVVLEVVERFLWRLNFDEV